MKKVYLANVHFHLLDEAYAFGSDSDRERMGADALSYLGLEIIDENYTAEGFLFQIVNEEKWAKAQATHDFLTTVKKND